MIRLIRLLVIVLAVMPAAVSAMSPMANKKSMVVSGHARFTVLTPEVVRIEYSPNCQFEDSATFAVVNRQLPAVRFKADSAGDFLTLRTDRFTLRYRKGSNPLTVPASADNLSVTFNVAGGKTEWFPGKSDPQNLKGTCRTLDNCDASKGLPQLEDGLISRSGWAVIDDSPATKRLDGSRSLAFHGEVNGVPWIGERSDGEALDIYLFMHGRDYKKALADFTLLAGKTPLPPDYVFGYWYSKYDAYSSTDYQNIMRSLNDNGINTDVLILDMDWHWNGNQDVSGGRGGWTGWTWNTNLIPDAENLLADIHSNGMRCALNLHPADGINADEDYFTEICTDLGRNPATERNVPWMLGDRNFYLSFFNRIMRAREKQGVDFWWLDWQQELVNRYCDGLGNTFWCNHVYFNDMKANRPGHRPVIFHRWGGLGSHRYQIGFSGDTFINYPTLDYESYFTATASNVGYAYWGHDLGGHQRSAIQDYNDPELLLRWLQFGVFTPIFRTHAATGQGIERRIWLYDNFSDLNRAVKLRYALFPYIYAMARKCYDTGVGICRPLYYEYPETEEAYTVKNQYFFGDDILVAPIAEPGKEGATEKEVWLPEGEWWSPSHNRMLSGNARMKLTFDHSQYPWFIRRGGIVVMNPESVRRVSERPDTLIVNFVAGESGSAVLYEDAGDTDRYPTEYATTVIEQNHKGNKHEFKIKTRRGSAPGIPESRAYTMRIYNAGRPLKATLDGKRVEVAYDAPTSCATVDIPQAPCSRERTLRLHY